MPHLDWRILTCFSVPLVLWGWWLWARLGRDKRWFVAPTAAISRNAYFALPTAVLGIFFVALELAFFLSNLEGSLILSVIAIGLWGLSLIIAYLEPNWMAPEWYRWLKREHGDIMPYLVLDANKLGRDTWMQRVETQQGLEEWAAEVRRKYEK